MKARSNELDAEYRELKSLSGKVDQAENSVISLQKQLANAENELDRLNGKIEVMRNRLFGEITGILEGRVMNGKNYIEQQDSSIVFLKGQMSQYQQSKKSLLKLLKPILKHHYKSHWRNIKMNLNQLRK